MAEELIAGNTQATGVAPAAPAAAAPAPAAAAPAAPQQDAAPAAGDKPAEGDKPAADNPADKGGDKPAGAPEKYEFKAPEGTEFNANVIAAYSEVAKELNLPQDAAQKVLDKVAPVMAAQHVEAVKKISAEWIDAVKSDKEYGGEKLDENIAIAKKALETFGTPELRTLLDTTGLGNNPELIRAFYRAGKAISEDRFVGGKGTPPASQSVAQRMYPNMNP